LPRMMSTDTSKIRSKLAKLDKSLDQLESHLEPLLAQSLPETLLALDTLQQAKLQVVIPYVVYDLVFVYLKSRGIDPKTHRVVAELDRVRQYFEKITHAEESDRKRKLGIDKAAAGRFIKHAITQALKPPSADEPSVAEASTSSERVPVKITSKMAARAQYEKELEELESEQEEDLAVFDDDEDPEAMDAEDGEPEDLELKRLDKGKGRASEEDEEEQVPSSRPKRPRVDPFSGYDDPVPQSTTDITKKAGLPTPVQSSSVDNSSRGASVSTSEDREARKDAKKAKRKSKKLRNS